MSGYMVIAAASQELRQILWQAFAADNDIRPIVGSEEAIVLKNPTQTARDSANRLSLWLYQVTENEFTKNQPLMRGSNDQSLQFPPLGLNLYYLLTPFATDGEADHMLLGKAMQTFYDNAIREVRNPANDIFEELRIVLCRLTLEELTRIWDALNEPYRLSICYQVRVTRIDSQRNPSSSRVVDRELGLSRGPADIRGG